MEFIKYFIGSSIKEEDYKFILESSRDVFRKYLKDLNNTSISKISKELNEKLKINKLYNWIAFIIDNTNNDFKGNNFVHYLNANNAKNSIIFSFKKKIFLIIRC